MIFDVFILFIYAISCLCTEIICLFTISHDISYNFFNSLRYFPDIQARHRYYSFFYRTSSWIFASQYFAPQLQPKCDHKPRYASQCILHVKFNMEGNLDCFLHVPAWIKTTEPSSQQNLNAS